MAKTKLDIKNIDINKIENDISLEGVSFEDAVAAADKLSSDIQSGRLDVAKTQKAYIFANKLLTHAKEVLDELSLTLEVVGEPKNELKEVILNGATPLFTNIIECVTKKDSGGVAVLLEQFANQVMESCNRAMSKEKS